MVAALVFPKHAFDVNPLLWRYELCFLCCYFFFAVTLPLLPEIIDSVFSAHLHFVCPSAAASLDHSGSLSAPEGWAG